MTRFPQIPEALTTKPVRDIVLSDQIVYNGDTENLARVIEQPQLVGRDATEIELVLKYKYSRRVVHYPINDTVKAKLWL